MIKVEKVGSGRSVEIKGEPHEILGDVSEVIVSLSELFAENEILNTNDKTEALKFIISAIYTAITSAEKNRP